MARSDKRPICTCNAYPFPHRVGGKCTAEDFLLYSLWTKEHCTNCNCYNNGCEVLDGKESLSNAECYTDQLHYNPGGRLPNTEDL